MARWLYTIIPIPRDPNQPWTHLGDCVGMVQFGQPPGPKKPTYSYILAKREGFQDEKTGIPSSKKNPDKKQKDCVVDDKRKHHDSIQA